MPRLAPGILGAVLLFVGLCGALVGWLVVGVTAPPAVQAQATGISICKQMRVNAKGPGSMAPLTVSSTVLQVVDANPSRCALWIIHEDGNNVRCGPLTGQFGGVPPTGTTGALIPASTNFLRL